MAFDGKYLWSTDNYAKRIHKIDPRTFTIAETIRAPGGNFPNGLTMDDDLLWVADNGRDSIYGVDVSGKFVAVSTGDLPEAQHSWRVYPNPSSGQFHFEHDAANSTPVAVQVYSVQGQMVYEQRFSSTRLFTADLSALPHGIYHYQLLETGGSRRSGALILR